jgi:hypothetical protein
MPSINAMKATIRSPLIHIRIHLPAALFELLLIAFCMSLANKLNIKSPVFVEEQLLEHSFDLIKSQLTEKFDFTLTLIEVVKPVADIRLDLLEVFL